MTELSDMIIGGAITAAVGVPVAIGVKRFLNWKKGKSKDAAEEFKEDVKQLADDKTIAPEVQDHKQAIEQIKTATEELRKIDPFAADQPALSEIIGIATKAVGEGRAFSADEHTRLSGLYNGVLAGDNSIKDTINRITRIVEKSADAAAKEVAIIEDNFNKRNMAATSNRRKLYVVAGVAALAGGLLLWNNYSGKKEAREAFEQATGMAYELGEKVIDKAIEDKKDPKKAIDEHKPAAPAGAESPEAKAAREKLENTVKELKDAEDARKKKEADAKAALPTVTSSFYTITKEGDQVNLVLSQYGKERTIKVIDAKAAINAINRIQQNDPLLSDRDYYNFEELSTLVEKLEKIGDGKITPEALDAVKNLKSLNEVTQLADEGAVYSSEMEKRLNNYIQKRVDLAHAKDEKDPSKIPDTKERRKMLLEQLAVKGEPHTIEAYDIETAEKAHDVEVDALGKDYSKFRISPVEKKEEPKAPEKTEEKTPEKTPEKSEKSSLEEYAAKLMPADEGAVTPPVEISSEPEEPKEAPKEEPPKEEPKGTPYVASHRVEIEAEFGGVAKAYLSALIDSRKEYNKTADKKQYVPETKAGELALLLTIDKDKNNQISASELEEACNNEKLTIEVADGEDYIEAKIELPSIKEASPEAARLDAIRELMKKAGDERKFLLYCEQYNTTLAKDGKFNLDDFEKYARKTYGDKK